VLAVIAAASFATAAGSNAQTKGARNYDPSTETTVTGTVEQVKQVTNKPGWSGSHLVLKTAKGDIEVHLGKTAFISKKGFVFAKGDQVEVSGSKVKYEGADAIIAREVKKGGKVLTLRDAQGVPVWSHGKSR
jgi:DNA/RNA endonuclease YhcR with UshA esterase domain